MPMKPKAHSDCEMVGVAGHFVSPFNDSFRLNSSAEGPVNGLSLNDNRGNMSELVARFWRTRRRAVL